MEIRLLKFETYGIKNIVNKISLDFANKTINKKSLKYGKVKAVYGGNGAGKSAIVNSFNIYRKLLLETFYLSQEKTQNNLKKLLNKNSKTLYFKSFFSIKANKDSNIDYYSHEISLVFKGDTFSISSETFKKIKGRLLDDDDEVIIYKTNGGKLVKFCEDDYFNDIANKTQNLLSSQSFVGTFFFLDLYDDAEKVKSDKNLYREKVEQYTKCIILISPILVFYMNSIVSLEAEDNNVLNKIPLKEYLKNKSIDLEKIQDDSIYILRTSRTDIVDKSKYDEYLKQIEKLTEFIKIFKPDLISIDIDKKVDGKTYKCNKVFNYGDYKIDIEYESTGIKKLVEIFSFLDEAMKGKIVFIDELDSNISPVFLNEFLEFFLEESKGQLCFTSHNLEPLNLLKSNFHSIDFLGETGKLVPWVNNGNYSAKNLYVEGMIQDSPFNFDSTDFYKVFDTIYKE